MWSNPDRLGQPKPLVELSDRPVDVTPALRISPAPENPKQDRPWGAPGGLGAEIPDIAIPLIVVKVHQKALNVTQGCATAERGQKRGVWVRRLRAQ